MKMVGSGGLRAGGYDMRPRLLQPSFDDGSSLQKSGGGENVNFK